MTKYVFNHLQDIKSNINKAKKILLFLDYDGTLVTFKKSPNQVKTPSNIRNVLRELSNIPNFKIGIITGRKLADIKNLIDNDGFIYAAVHGLIIDFPGYENFIWEKAEKNKKNIQKIKKTLLKEFDQKKGIFIEDKKFTLAFHYRKIPENIADIIIKKFTEIVKKISIDKNLEMISGDKVMEIRPKGWNKGRAVEKIIDIFNNDSDLLPIYIGDDTTDEDAFRFLEKKGITIFVSNNSQSKTKAIYFVDSPDGVFRFLKWIKKNS